VGLYQAERERAAHEFDRVRVSMEGVFRIIVAAIGLHLVCFTAIDIAGYVHVFQMDVVAIGAIGFDGLRYGWLLWLLCRSGHQHSINHAKTRVEDVCFTELVDKIDELVERTDNYDADIEVWKNTPESDPDKQAAKDLGKLVCELQELGIGGDIIIID